MSDVADVKRIREVISAMKRNEDRVRTLKYKCRRERDRDSWKQMVSNAETNVSLDARTLRRLLRVALDDEDDVAAYMFYLSQESIVRRQKERLSKLESVLKTKRARLLPL